jgi:tetratricopeptide (TPR) repeat protein
MIIKSVKLATQLVIAIALLFPTISFSDQTDTRLDQLFEVLKSSENPYELQETEAAIWEIWYESGQQGIDELMQEAREAMQANDLRRAEVLYSEVIDMAPDFSEGWNRRATVRYYRRNYDGSLDDIRHTLVLEARHFGAIWGLGMILGSQRDFIGAITAFERLLEIKPNSRDARPRIELLKQELVKSAV